MKTTQKEQIKLALLKGHHFSKIQMLEKFGCLNSGEIIRQLRHNDNFPITMTKVLNHVSNTRFAVYNMELCNCFQPFQVKLNCEIWCEQCQKPTKLY